jgi:hypothetical protein
MKRESPSGAAPLPRDIRDFLVELRTEFGPEVLEQWRTALEALDREGDMNLEAAKMLQALGIIASRPRPLRERLDALCDVLMSPPGRITVNIKLGAD